MGYTTATDRLSYRMTIEYCEKTEFNEFEGIKLGFGGKVTSFEVLAGNLLSLHQILLKSHKSQR